LRLCCAVSSVVKKSLNTEFAEALRALRVKAERHGGRREPQLGCGYAALLKSRQQSAVSNSKGLSFQRSAREILES